MIIKKIVIKKKRVEVLCSDNTSFNISLETYLNSHILVNDTIEKKDIDKLISRDTIDVIKMELINKLSRKKLSKNECRNYLSSSNLKDEIVEKIINELEKNYFINDEELAEAIVVSNLINKKGKKIMIETFFTRLVMGNYQEYINKFIDNERYKSNILYLIDKYKKMGSNKSNKILKQYIISKMINNGYSIEEFEMFLTELENDETDIIRKEIAKFFKTKEINEENITKITKKLLSKGFNYGIIKNALEGVLNNETY